jgi:RNA polymerase subunit RPABC4/transcription elongation factor Spt4
MASLAQAEAAHYGRLDYAYQRQLDDYDDAITQLDRCTTLADLDQYGFEPTLLESQFGFDRYQINIGSGDDDKRWICTDCGAITENHLRGCDSCGFHSFEWYEGMTIEDAEALEALEEAA